MCPPDPGRALDAKFGLDRPLWVNPEAVNQKLAEGVRNPIPRRVSTGAAQSEDSEAAPIWAPILYCRPVTRPAYLSTRTRACVATR